MPLRFLNSLLLTTACLLAVGLLPTEVMAQSLVWSLPESGTGVKYSGEYRQITFRPESDTGDLSLDWRRNLEIRCLERETATIQGQEIKCVWIEYEVVTGQLVDGQLEAGPGSRRIYKVLIPESAIQGIDYFQSEVPNAFIPVVAGFQKIGDGAVESISTRALQVFPVITQLLINRGVTEAGEESASVTAGQFASMQYQCETTLEAPSSKTTNNSQAWISDEIPFGIVQWRVRINRETKTPADTRNQFQKRSEITVDMQAVEILNNVTAKISSTTADYTPGPIAQTDFSMPMAPPKAPPKTTPFKPIEPEPEPEKVMPAEPKPVPGNAAPPQPTPDDNSNSIPGKIPDEAGDLIKRLVLEFLL